MLTIGNKNGFLGAILRKGNSGIISKLQNHGLEYMQQNNVKPLDPTPPSPIIGSGA